MGESASLAWRARPFLGVSASALGRFWRERCDVTAMSHALAICQTHGLPDMLGRVLAGRGVRAHEAMRLIEPRLRDLLPDPSTLLDMDAAAERLARAIVARETVAVFGDYDVDGAASAALLASYLGRCGTPYRIHIPDRITEGYGPNVEAIQALRAAGASLLVTVDCGSASHEALAEAARLGLDTIVADHHQAPEALPAALAMVNPNRQDDLSGLGDLAAAGVVFLLLVATARALRRQGFWSAGSAEPDLIGDLDLVALATVADVVPLRGLNRAFVRQGLAVMRRRRRPGLTALFDVASVGGPPECWHLGYVIGPRINAGGRIGEAALGAKLLLTADPGEAARLAADLDRLNRERQAIEQIAVEDAAGQVLAALDRDGGDCVVVAASQDWHPGIVGLVAARLRERFRRPAFAFALRADGGGVGSGRSIAGIDLGAAVRAAAGAGVAVKGGGHAMAAGVTLAPGMLACFGDFLRQRFAAAGVADGEDVLDIDAALTAQGASPELVRAVERAGPFGAGNAEPVFAFARHRLVEAMEMAGGHVRARLKSGDGAVLRAIAFRAAGQPLGEALAKARGELVSAAGTLSLDRWGGAERVDLRLIDLATA